jgi:hypothetical protein
MDGGWFKKKVGAVSARFTSSPGNDTPISAPISFRQEYHVGFNKETGKFEVLHLLPPMICQFLPFSLIHYAFNYVNLLFGGGAINGTAHSNYNATRM